MRRDSGNNGFVVPSIPRAPRSARKRAGIKRKSEGQAHPVCGFDLLAAVAGKLLEETENSSASSNETEAKDQFVIYKDDVKLEKRNERQISEEHASALCTSDGSENVETDLRIGISVGADVSPKMPGKTRTARHFGGLSDDGMEFEAKQHAEECGPKQWRVSTKLRDRDSCASEGARYANCVRKTHSERERGFDDIPVKKRKLCDQTSDVTSDRGFSSDSFSKSDDECANMNKCSNGVRLSIKSFKVPELLVEVPVTATVASLKTRVLEAVSSVLRGGLNVEVMVRGKKVTDDSETLTESGISHKCNVESLGFMLQPSTPQSPTPRCQNDDPVPAGDFHKPPERFPDIVLGAESELCNKHSPSPLLSKKVKADHEVAQTLSNAVPKKSQESKALALFPITTADPLAMVPLDQKSKRSELAQRRTRRPFSVSEVEALVQAVEELGTGRWRDVKMRSFENAEHRTYVDLKDKWKTLVHTAQISPQQRRGQPVPQELLNRVLAAHSYWPQHHQMKSHPKSHFLQSGRTD